MNDQIKLESVDHDHRAITVRIETPDLSMASAGTWMAQSKGEHATGLLVSAESASDLREIAMVLLEAADLEDGKTSARFEYRVRGERSEGVNAGMEWGNNESDWKSHLPRRYDVEILARRRNRDVMVERRAMIVGEPTVVAFEDLAP